MDEMYVKSIEEENEKLREKLAAAQEELDKLKEKQAQAL